MSPTVRIESRPDGMVAVKEATGAESARLATEADFLARARHPGLVARLDFTTGTDGSARLVTRHVGNRSLATPAARSIGQSAALAAALATTVADLHALGLAHGRIEASHVLLDEEGRPVLCSPSGTGRPSDDVAGVGEVLASLLGQHPDGDPIPDRRFSRPPSRSRRRGYLHRALLNVADQARADEHTRRPTARVLAATIHDLVPEATFDAPPTDGSRRSDGLPSGGDDDDDDEADTPALPRRGRGTPMLLALAAAAGLGLILVGGWSLVSPSRPPSPLASSPTSPDTAPRPECPSATPDATLDVDGDGCADEVEAADGVVTVGPRRWAVGEPTDHVVVGDWDCDGQVTAALLRPATGEVFVFDRWAGPDDELKATSAATVVGAASIDARARPATSCHRVEVRDDQGRVHPVDVSQGR